MGVLQVHPEESGPKYLLGNSSNNPSNQKPVIVLADILKHVICMVEESGTTNMTDCVFKVGDAFTKTSVDDNSLGRFILDEKKDTPFVLVKVRACFPVTNDTTPVQGKINEETLSALSNLTPDAQLWAELLEDFDAALHKSVLANKTKLAKFISDNKHGHHFLTNDSLPKFNHLVVEDDLQDKISDDYDILLTKLTSISEAQSTAKQPPDDYIDIDSRIPRNVRASQSVDYDDNTLGGNITTHTVEQHDAARFLLQMAIFDGEKAKPPVFNDEGRLVIDAGSRRLRNSMSEGLIETYQEDATEDSTDVADRLLNIPPMTPYMHVSQSCYISFSILLTKPSKFHHHNSGLHVKCCVAGR